MASSKMSPPSRWSSVTWWIMSSFVSPPPPASGGFFHHVPYRHTRTEHSNQDVLEILKDCCVGLKQDAKEGKILKEDAPGTGGSQQHRHESLLPVPPLSPFILDSGATHHVTGDMSLFSSSFTTAIPASCAAAYQARDGALLTVAGAGTISCGNFHISNVLYVPGLRGGLNLVSVQQLAEDYLIMFGGGNCSVKDQSSGKIVGKGRMHEDDGLYHLEFLKIPINNADGEKGGRAP